MDINIEFLKTREKKLEKFSLNIYCCNPLVSWPAARPKTLVNMQFQ